MKPLNYFFASLAAMIRRASDPGAPPDVRRQHLGPKDAAELELLSAIFDTYRRVEGPEVSPDDFAHGWLRLAMPSLNRISGSLDRQLPLPAARAAARRAELAVMACEDQTWVLGFSLSQYGAGTPPSPVPRFSPYRGSLVGACSGWSYVVAALNRTDDLLPDYQSDGQWKAAAAAVHSLAAAAAGRELDALRETYMHELQRLQAMALAEAMNLPDRSPTAQGTQDEELSVLVRGETLIKELRK